MADILKFPRADARKLVLSPGELIDRFIELQINMRCSFMVGDFSRIDEYHKELNFLEEQMELMHGKGVHN